MPACLPRPWLPSRGRRPLAGRAAEPPKPNFVVILIDDMGYGDVGPFGSKLNRTPHLDRMAREGMKLTSFYGAPVCTPSRAQMMTGCYAKRVSLPNVIFPACPIGISAKEHTVAELLETARLCHHGNRQMAPGRPARVSANAARFRSLSRPALLQRHGWDEQGRQRPRATAAALASRQHRDRGARPIRTRSRRAIPRKR